MTNKEFIYIGSDFNMETIDVSFIQTIIDMGFSSVAGAIIIIIAYKIFSSLMRQNKTTFDSLLPEVSQINDQLDEVKSSLNEHLTSHNAAMKLQVSELELKINKIIENQARLEKSITECNQMLMFISSPIIRQQVASTTHTQQMNDNNIIDTEAK